MKGGGLGPGGALRLAGLVLLLGVARAACGVGSVIAFGGGELPAGAVGRFVAEAGGREARILVVTWATATPPAEAFEGIAADFRPHHPLSIAMAPAASAMVAERERFLSQLAQATGLFFSGGDQNRITEVLNRANVGQHIRDRHQAGLIVGGTSAGAAVLSAVMITGNREEPAIAAESVEVAGGLGVVRGAVLDQHFLKRRRLGRLMSAVLASADFIGVGIEEGSAIAVTDGRIVEALGSSQATVVIEGPGRPQFRFSTEVLAPGDRFDLQTRAHLGGISDPDRAQ